VTGLLAARTDLATQRFDEELDGAVDRGEVSAETAHRLRLWQRASVRAVTEHAREVLPAALTALDDAGADAEKHVEGLLETLRERLPVVLERAPASLPPASSPPTSNPPATINLEAPRRRLLVAGLVAAAPSVTRDQQPATRSQKPVTRNRNR
jgi:hypothetical protein